MNYFKPVFCDKDPKQAAKALDDTTLNYQLHFSAILLSACELVIYAKAKEHDQEDLIPEYVQPDMQQVPTLQALEEIVDGGVLDWALGSQSALNWLTLYALACHTEACDRGIYSRQYYPAEIEQIVHRCFARMNMYGFIIRGEKRGYTAPGLPVHIPNDEGSESLVNKARRQLMKQWATSRAEPTWSRAVPPSWMAFRGRTLVAQ